MNRVPGPNSSRSSFITNMSGSSVSWRMQLTTMSCSAEELGDRSAPGAVERERAARVHRISLVVHQPRRRDRRGHRRNAAMRQHGHVVHPEREQRRHRAARGGSEADHRGAQPAAVVPARAQQRERVQDRAIAGELVVLVEDVKAEVAVVGPVIHGLPGDERQTAVDGELGHLAVLDAVRRHPHRTWPGRIVVRSAATGLGSRITSHSAISSSRVSRPLTCTVRLSSEKSNPIPVALLKEDVAPHVGAASLDLLRVDRQPVLVSFRDPRRRQSSALITTARVYERRPSPHQPHARGLAIARASRRRSERGEPLAALRSHTGPPRLSLAANMASWPAAATSRLRSASSSTSPEPSPAARCLASGARWVHLHIARAAATFYQLCYDKLARQPRHRASRGERASDRPLEKPSRGGLELVLRGRADVPAAAVVRPVRLAVSRRRVRTHDELWPLQ